jgi:hypothetical protein
VGEDLLDRLWILHTGDDPDCPAAGRVGLDVATVYPRFRRCAQVIEANRSAAVGSSGVPCRPP